MSRPEEPGPGLGTGKALANGAGSLVIAGAMVALAVGNPDARLFAIATAVVAVLVGAGFVFAAVVIRHAHRHPDSAASRRVAEAERLTPPRPTGRTRARDLALLGVLVVLMVVTRLEAVPEAVRLVLVVPMLALVVVVAVTVIRRVRFEHRWRRDRMAD
ncbi:hypothetical protein QE364_003855 [Nocardioides zeae]|uniref:Uncharacterized protein n=1 Tax=Nocardioides zeae TaxID=1457234 RepID=A0ACC6IN60_9ACTN|nr:hypothetical protein [Nocardioides zeae]MDR6174403.1 hypothetical protein [Nocardioides zeae]MDR6212124.1 hypothetical protein [Nocardioides zeae]